MGCARAKRCAGKPRGKETLCNPALSLLPENISRRSIFQSREIVPFTFFQVLAILKRDRSEEQRARTTQQAVFSLPAAEGSDERPLITPR